MWVKTIVFTRPMRRASHAAPRCETAFIIRAPKNRAPITASLTPKRSKKKYDKQCGSEKTAGETVDREQGGDLEDDRTTSRGDARALAAGRSFDLRTEAKVQDGGHQSDRRAHQEQRSVRARAGLGGRGCEQRRQPGQERSQRMPQVLKHRVPGDHLRAIGGAGRGGQSRLFEDQRGAAILAHAVEHPDEGSGRERERPRCVSEGHRARDRERRERDQKPASPDAIGEKGGNHRGECGTDEARRHDGPEGSAGNPLTSQKYAEQHADQAGRDRAQERGHVEEEVGQSGRRPAPAHLGDRSRGVSTTNRKGL